MAATKQPTGQIRKNLSSPLCKNILIFRVANQSIASSRPAPPEGRSRSSRTWGGMRWTPGARQTKRARGGRRRRVVLAPRCWCQVPGKQASRGDGGKKAVRREEHVISRKPSRREGRIASAEPVCSCAYSTISAHGTAGAARTRSSLRPLLIERGRNGCSTRADRAAAMRTHASSLFDN